MAAIFIFIFLTILKCAKYFVYSFYAISCTMPKNKIVQFLREKTLKIYLRKNATSKDYHYLYACPKLRGCLLGVLRMQ